MQADESTKKIAKRIVTEVDDFGRKKFTLVEQEQPDGGQQQDNAFISTGRYKSTLVGRQQRIDRNKYIGKIDNNKKNKKTEVFYCQVCKLGFKCDLAYITHINSPSHNRKLGMNMKVDSVSKQSVIEKLRRLEAQKRSKMSKKQAKITKIIEKQMAKQQPRQQQPYEQPEHQERQQIANRQATQMQKAKQQEQILKQENVEKLSSEQANLSVNPDEQLMMQCLGFSSFGSKKRKY